MIEPKFQKGDVVELNSGSVKMTVWFVNDKGMVHLYYYDHITNSIKSPGELPQSVLRLAD